MNYLSNIARPYLFGALAVLVGLIFLGGTRLGWVLSSAKHKDQLAKVEAQLAVRSESLRSANAAIEDIRAEAKRAVEAEQQAKRNEVGARALADSAAARLSRERASFDNRLKAAARVARCAALLDASVGEVCKL